MTVKTKMTNESGQERDQVLRVLRPVLARAKVKDKKDKKPHKTVYIELADLPGGEGT
jgi:hypothetical protein